MRTLILLTDSYPFGSGEDFLENELKCSQSFEKILILPLHPNSDTITKYLPENAETILITDIINNKTDNIKTVFSTCVISEVLRNIKSPRIIHELLYFYKNALRITNTVIKKISDKLDGDVTIYSYWLMAGALIATMLKPKLISLEYKCSAFSRAHRYDLYPETSSTNYLPFRRHLLKRLNRVFPCSKNGTEYLQKKYPKYREKVCTSYLGTIDNGQNVATKETEFHLVSCSYISPVKRIPLLIEAVSKINTPIKWTHIGGGADYNTIIETTKKLPQNIKCEFIGSLTNSEVVEFYKNNHPSALINVSSSEGLPVSIMEALSLSLPVIATDVGGTSEAVIDGFNGYLLKSDVSSDEIADTILKLINLPPAEYKKLCLNARKHWDKNFNAEVNYKQFYREISNNREGCK